MGGKKNYAPRAHNSVVKNNSNMVSNTYPDMHSEYIHNNPSNNYIYPIVRNILNRFVRLTEEIFEYWFNILLKMRRWYLNG